MRNTAKIVSAGAVLFAITACGSPQAATTPGSGGGSLETSAPQAEPGAGQTAVPGRPPQMPPEGSAALPAAQLDAKGLPSGFPQEVYRGRNEDVVYVKAEEGGCGRAVATPVEQNAERVIITLTEDPGAPGQMCTMDIRYPVVAVKLDAPLGDRTVVLNKEPRNR